MRPEAGPKGPAASAPGPSPRATGPTAGVRRVAVTGAAGFLGRALVDRIAADPNVELVLGIDLRADPRMGRPPANVMWAARDVREPLDHLLKENRIGGVVHLAYVLRPSHDHRRVRSINVGGTENLIAACEAAGASVMVYPSSTTVYGAHRDYERPYLETDSPRPVAGFQYSEDKAEAERLLLDFSARRGTRVAVLRAPPVMGQSADNFIVRSLTRRWLPSPSGVDVEFQFLHLDDLLDALVLALRSQSQGIYNISGSGTVRWREMARAFGNHVFPVPGSLLRAATGLSWALRLQSESPACGVDFIRYPWLADCSKITRELGWRPRYSSEQALQAARPAIGIPQ